MTPTPPSSRTIVIITLLVALGPLATDLYLPALPILTEAFHTNSSKVQLTLSIYFIGFAVGQLIYGPLSDRFGRKPVMLGGMLLFVVCSGAAVYAGSIESLIAIRLLQALGGCVGPVLGRAMVRDLYTPAEAGRVLSHIASAMALAPAFAPIIGGYLTVLFGWEANFWLLLGYGLLVLTALVFGIPETVPQKNPRATNIRQLLANYLTLARHPVWRRNTLICSFIFAGLFAFLSGSSFVLIDYLGVSEQGYGFLFALVVAGFITGSQISARLSRRTSAPTIIRYGCWVGLLAGLAMLGLSLSGVHSVAALVGPQFFYMMAVGMVMPHTLAGALAPFPHMAGTVSALFGTVQMLIAALHGGLVGHFHTGTPTAMVIGIAFPGLMAFVLMWGLRRKEQPDHKHAHGS